MLWHEPRCDPAVSRRGRGMSEGHWGTIVADDPHKTRFDVWSFKDGRYRSTQVIQDTAKQMRLYLKGTVGEGLKLDEKPVDPINLYVYSDPSFAPESDESHGSFVVMANGSLMFWRSGRQSAVNLSTAESELTELVEAMVAGESVFVIISELFAEVDSIALCDSQAALAILMAEGGSWRTRHLRLWWAFARQSVLRGDWQVGQVPRTYDSGLGNKGFGINTSGASQGNAWHEKDWAYSIQKKKQQKRLITMTASLQMSKAQEDEEEESSAEFNQLVMIYTVLVMIFTLGLQALWKVGACSNLKMWLLGGESRSLPAEDEEPEIKRPNFEEVMPRGDQSSRAVDGSGQRVLAQLARAGRRHTVEETAVAGPNTNLSDGRDEDGWGERVLVQLAQAGRRHAVEETAVPGPTTNFLDADQSGAQDGSEQRVLVQLGRPEARCGGDGCARPSCDPS